MGASINLLALSCEGCGYAKGTRCTRDGDYSQSYERAYTDSDFCGPDRRYYKQGIMSRLLTPTTRKED